MMRWIVGSSLQFRLLVVMIATMIMFFGFTQLRDMPVDTIPEFSRPYVEIQTEALGLSAEEVEAMITVPLEADMLNGVSWVDEIRSESIPGLSSIVLVFEPGTDMLDARQMVQERLIEVYALPGVSKPPAMLNPLSSTSRVMAVGLSSEKLSHIEMSVLARWTIQPRLMGVPGVANVSIWGQRKRQLQVQVDPERLREEGITLNQVISTAGNALWFSPLKFLKASTPGTGGFIDTPNQRLGIRHLLPISTPEDLAHVTIEGSTKRLGDVTEVVEDHQPLIGDAVIGDEPNLMLVIEKFPWASTLEVTRGVEQALDALRPGLSGLEMDSSLYRPATFIETALGNLSTALLIGGGLVLAALLAFLFYWRTALISTVAILVSLMAAGLVLYLTGAPINMMVLAGIAIALGVVIDDAVIDVEGIARRLRKHRDQAGSEESTAWLIRESALLIRSPVIYATLILMLAVLPILFIEGVLGAIFRPMVLSYALALVVSMAVALLVTPSLCLMLLARPPLERVESPLVGWLGRGYSTVLAGTVRRPGLAFGVFVVIVVAGLAAVPWLSQGSLLPTFKETDLMVEVEGAAGMSHPAMGRIASQAGRELRSIPGVRNVCAHVGRAVMSDEVSNVNCSQLWVSLDPAADYDATVAKVRETVEGYPGLDVDVLTYTNERLQEEMTGSDTAVAVRIYGEDWKVLAAKAEEVRQALSRIDGIVSPEVELPVEQPTLKIEPDLAASKKHGLKPGDVRRAAACLLSGFEVSYLFEEQKVFDVVVLGTPETRHSLTSVQELLIDTPTGDHVRLAEVVDVRIVPAPNVIKRDAVARRIDVDFNVRGRDLAAVAHDVERALQEIEFPLEYRTELLGHSAQRMAVQRRVLSVAVAAAIGIFLLLQATFLSWRLATLVFLTLPLALTGGAVAALAGGGIVTLGSLLGCVAVLGVATRNAITLVRHYQHLAETSEDAPGDHEWSGPALVMRGTRERLGPILTTAVATALVFLPLALFGNIAGLEIVHPMAVVVLGSLVSATLFTLVGVPALYLLSGARPAPDLEDLQGPAEREEEAPEVASKPVGVDREM